MGQKLVIVVVLLVFVVLWVLNFVMISIRGESKRKDRQDRSKKP